MPVPASVQLFSAEHLDLLFPPSPTASLKAQTLEISSSACISSTTELMHLLQADIENWHLYFNHRGYHNHLSHHLYAAYALGASPITLKATYEKHAKFQRKSFLSPSPINDINWKSHLGDERYYHSYLIFFTEKVISNGISPILENYIFSLEANHSTTPFRDTCMLSRFLGGLLHSFIQFGHGVEFNVLGTTCQGLGWAAVHNAELSVLFPPEFFLVSEPSTKLLWNDGDIFGTEKSYMHQPHSFSILAHMLKDQSLACRPDAIDFRDQTGEHLSTFLNLKANCIREYARRWAIDTSNPQVFQAKLKELTFLAVLIYGVGGWSPERFRADFFTMHFVTSSVFLPSTLQYLNPTSKSIMLRAWFTFLLVYWVKRGRPDLHIRSFYEESTAALDELEGETDAEKWSSILGSIFDHPDEHYMKLQRALSHYDRLYGQDIRGSFGNTGLKEADLIDGSLFIRVAALTAVRVGGIGPGKVKSKGLWDRSACFDGTVP